MEGEQRGRGAEQRTGERGEELRSRGDGMSGGEREGSNTGGDWDKPRRRGGALGPLGGLG